MYSDALDANFGQHCHIVQRVKEDCACFELLFATPNYHSASDQTQTFVDDLIISQLQAIFQLFLSYLPSGEFCQVNELNMQAKSIAEC